MWFPNLNKKYPPLIINFDKIRFIKLYFYNIHGYLFIVWFKKHRYQEYEFIGQFKEKLSNKEIKDIFNKFVGLSYLIFKKVPWDTYFRYESDFSEKQIRKIFIDGVELFNLRGDNSLDGILLKRIMEIKKNKNLLK